ncbi:unnamed protein product [Chrysoparadoxa australica]
MKEAKELQSELERFKEKAAAKKEKSNQQRQKLEGDCRELCLDLQKANAAEEELREKYEALKKRAKADAEMVQQKEQELRDYRGKAQSNDDAEARASLEKRGARQEETIEELESELKKLKKRLADSENGVPEAEARARQARAEAEDARVSLARIETEKETLEGELERTRVKLREIEQSSRQAIMDFNQVQERCNQAQAKARAAREEAEGWEAKYQSERVLRRQLHERVLDLQGNIRVFCRLRPLQPHELKALEGDDEYGDPLGNILYPDDDKLNFWGAKYEFNSVYAPGVSQEKIFHDVQPVVAAALNGYRVCVFAYGQTGSGKTYTMEGPRGDRGVNFRALNELFDLAAQDRERTFTFRVSMLEVYNESVKDLLIDPASADKARKHEIRLDKRGRVFVEGLVECMVEQLDEVEQLIALGAQNRTVGNNNVNLHSSRSHLVFQQVNIAVTDKKSGQQHEGKLNLIDLAGSERIKSTAAEGQRLKEAQNINRSLSALGDVIASLGSSSKHVPYRNSKLTFLLQDSLSASSKVVPHCSKVTSPLVVLNEVSEHPSRDLSCSQLALSFSSSLSPPHRYSCL